MPKIRPLPGDSPIRAITVFDFQEAIGGRPCRVEVYGFGGDMNCHVANELNEKVFAGTPKEVLHWLREQP